MNRTREQKKRRAGRPGSLRTVHGGRAESGLMQFGDDWCGVFIRGDHACLLAAELQLPDLLALLLRAGEDAANVQRVKAWRDAKERPGAATG